MLIGTALVFLMGQLGILYSEYINAVILFYILMVCHLILGTIAWRSHYRDWPNAIMYLTATALFIVMLTVNWTVYTPPALASDTYNTLFNLLIWPGFLLTAVMLVAGPIIALTDYPRPGEFEE